MNLRINGPPSMQSTTPPVLGNEFNFISMVNVNVILFVNTTYHLLYSINVIKNNTNIQFQRCAKSLMCLVALIITNLNRRKMKVDGLPISLRFFVEAETIIGTTSFSKERYPPLMGSKLEKLNTN